MERAGESRIIRALTGFCGSSDTYYTYVTVPVGSKCLQPIYSVYCSIKILKLFPRHFNGKRERERKVEGRERERQRGERERERMKTMNNSWPLTA